jgi:hypothetical protein
MTKSEYGMTKEIRMPKSETIEIWRCSFRSFKLRASFDLRHSTFVIL